MSPLGGWGAHPQWLQGTLLCLPSLLGSVLLCLPHEASSLCPTVAKLHALGFKCLEESPLDLIFISDWKLPEAGKCLSLGCAQGSEQRLPQEPLRGF